jgi:hypothetical protein
MNALRPLWQLAQLTWYRWALSEIHPLHDDVPHIVRTISQLEAQRGAR